MIIDDEMMLTNLISDHLKDNGYLPYVANSAQEALDKINIAPDLILLDIRMPGMSGLELCKTIRDHVICPIVFLTALATDQDTINGLLAGGDDYITKPFSLPALTARIAAHLRRDIRRKNAAELLLSHELLVNLSERTVNYQENQISFSKTEFDIIEFLVTNAGQVFDRERLYEAVWGLDADGDSGVIREHIRKIRQKLKESTGKEYIETIWGVGYRWNR